MKKILTALFVLGFILSAAPALATSAPTIVSASATNITSTSAKLNGVVNPNGSSTFAWYETANDGPLGTVNIGSGTNNVTVLPYTLSGLQPNTNYIFRVVASNVNGITNGNWISFTTTSSGGCNTGCNPPPSLPTVNLTANPTSVSYGGSSTLSWNSTNATSCNATGGTNGWSGPKATNGTFYTGNLYNTLTYTLTCSNSAGSATDSVTVYVAAQPYNPPSAPSVNLSANPTSVQYGGSSALSWTSSNATSCYATGAWSGSKPTSGTWNTGSLTSTKTYTLTCTGPGGSASNSVTVYVAAQPYNPPSTPSVNLSANPTSVQYGGSSTLSWNSTNATSCNATGGTNGWSGPKATNGTFYTGNLYNTTTYNITCTGSGGSATKSVTVSVGNQPQQNQPTVNLTAAQTYVTSGGSTTLSWTSTFGTSCVASGGANGWAGPKSTSGTFYTGALPGTTTYSITCTNSYGSATDSVTIYIQSNPGNQNPPTINFTGTNISLSFNGSTTLYWSTTGATSCLATNGANGWAGVKPTSGSFFTGNLTQTTIFTLTCTNSFGSTTASVTVTIGGQNNDKDLEVSTKSATSIAATSATLNGELEEGDNAEVWFEYSEDEDDLEDNDCDNDCEETNDEDADEGDDFNDRITGLKSDTTYYFRAVAKNSSGTDYGNIRSFRTSDDGGNTNFGTAPQAITTLATNIGSSAARLNGLAITSGSALTSGYFEWGSTPSLGNTTPSTIVGTVGSNPFSSSIFGLSSNRTYYYRAVATNQYGISRGDIVSFRTTGGSVAGSSTTVIKNVATTTVIGGTARPSLVFLSISHNDEVIRHGEIVEYVINYRNISTKNLKDVLLRVVLPKELQFVDTSRGYFSEPNNTVVVNIGDLLPNEEGSVFVTAKVLPSAEVGKIIVVTANLAYTVVADNTQEEVFAYSKNTIEDGVNLSGAALFGGGFLPNSLFGWLCLLLLLILILLVARMAYNHGRPTHQTIMVPQAPQAPAPGTTVHTTTTHRGTLL